MNKSLLALLIPLKGLIGPYWPVVDPCYAAGLREVHFHPSALDSNLLASRTRTSLRARMPTPLGQGPRGPEPKGPKNCRA